MRFLASLCFAAATFAATYQIDTGHSSANFTVKHMMVTNVRGSFSGVTGQVVYDAKNVAASKVEATINADTVNTNQAKRDAHLKTPDFFDVVKFPTIQFVSTKVEPAGQSKFKVTGNLTMHGVTKPVVLMVEGPAPEVKDASGGFRTGASATTKISRKEFGLTWNKMLEAGGVTVSDEVAIELDLQFIRK
jgi:polyisoprenoid-binding protein YceI